MLYVWRRGWLRAVGTCGLLGAAIIYHGIYNLLIASGGQAQYIAYALPILSILLGTATKKLFSRLSRPTDH